MIYSYVEWNSIDLDRLQESNEQFNHHFAVWNQQRLEEITVMHEQDKHLYEQQLRIQQLSSDQMASVRKFDSYLLFFFSFSLWYVY